MNIKVGDLLVYTGFGGFGCPKENELVVVQSISNDKYIRIVGYKGIEFGKKGNFSLPTPEELERHNFPQKLEELLK